VIVYIYLYHNYLPPHAKHSHFLADHPGFSVEPRYKVRSGIYSHHDYKLKLDFTPGQGVKDSQKKILIPTELCLLLPLKLARLFWRRFAFLFSSFFLVSGLLPVSIIRVFNSHCIYTNIRPAIKKPSLCFNQSTIRRPMLASTWRATI